MIKFLKMKKIRLYLVLLIAFLSFNLSENAAAQQVVLKHHFYTNWYNCIYRISDSIKYTLTKKMIVNNFSRLNYFKKDPLFEKSPISDDWTNSGYDRGHLVPAASCSGDSIAMLESFFTTNITMQKHEFNAGIWYLLEKYVREILESPDVDSVNVSIYPVFNENDDRISNDSIIVPDAFIKSIVAFPSLKKEVYSIPNKATDKNISYFRLK